jgi:hypothetical protein
MLNAAFGTANAQRSFSAAQAVQTLAAKPTEGIEAYDYFLRGNEYGNRSFRSDDQHMAAEMYRKSVAIVSERRPNPGARLLRPNSSVMFPQR